MANDTPLISIVIPVYNAERYLPRCLDSVTAQTLTDFEALVVNDCSPDPSPAPARVSGLTAPPIPPSAHPPHNGTLPPRRRAPVPALRPPRDFRTATTTLTPLPPPPLHALTADGDDIVLAGVRMISPDGEIKLKPRIRADVRTRSDMYEALLRQRITWYMCAAIFRRTWLGHNLETFTQQCANADYMILHQLPLITARLKFDN